MVVAGAATRAGTDGDRRRRRHRQADSRARAKRCERDRGRARPRDARRARAGRARRPSARRNRGSAPDRRRRGRCDHGRVGVSLVRRPGGGRRVPPRAPARRQACAAVEPPPERSADPPGRRRDHRPASSPDAEPPPRRMARTARVSGLFAAVAERQVPFEQVLDADGFVDRFSSISFVAALPDGERERVLERLRAAAAAADQPMRLGLHRRGVRVRARGLRGREEPRRGPRIPGAWQPRTRSRALAGSPI